MKTIGILGGIGPQATMDLEQRIHREAQRVLPPMANAGYPPMIVWYHRKPPFVMSEIHRPVLPLQLDPDLVRGAKWLGQVADFIIISANGPHMVQDQIEQASGKRILSMIDTTLTEIQGRGWKIVGVMGFGDPSMSIYAVPLQRLGIATELLTSQMQAPINEAVPRLMAGTETDEDRQSVRNAVEELRSREVDGIILGCTELPLLFGDDVDAPDLLNPAQVLAEAAVKEAMS